jgi:hydrogenase/urease accessory protein HupE
MMTRTIRRILLVATSLLLLPAAAHAHLTGTGLGPFYDGVTHFFLSPEQIIPGLALGLFAGLRGKRSGRIALFLLPAAWLIGGLMGTARPVTGQFTLLACFSFLVLGALVAFDAQLEPRYVAALSLCFGLALGYVNGSDFSTTNVGALGVLGSATSLFVLVTLSSALVVSLRVPWTRIVVRVAGSWIVAAGLLLFGWTFHSTPKQSQSHSSADQSFFSYPRRGRSGIRDRNNIDYLVQVTGVLI